jgi:branched-chain amino acid transport system ATP-binding protein
MHNASEVLTVEQLTVRFGAITAVDAVSLALRRGERHALLGTNGAGKTTLFNAVCGTVPISAGRVRLAGRDIGSLAVHQRARLGLSRTFQTSLTFADRTVHDNLRVALLGSQGGCFSLRRWAAHVQVERQAAQLLQDFGLQALADKAVGTLSYGLQREIEVAMALAGQPELLLLDEPAAGMSPQGRAQLLARLLKLPRSITLLFVEHDMDVALALADCVTVMRDGHVVASGPPETISRNPVVKEMYLGVNA